MARENRDERWTRIHADAIAQFTRIQDALSDERALCKEDRRFYSIRGAQWEGALGEQFASKPMLEVNKVHLAVIRIINEWRNNRITVDFIPKDGSEADALADVCDGLFRADEADSGAEEAYDNAFEEAVGGGFGALRLRAAYEDEEDPADEKQRIRIEPIYDADASVFFDLDAKRQDKADARHCFVLYSMDRESYKAEYDDDPADWPKEAAVPEDWCTPDVVVVAEYYLVEQGNDRAIIFRSLTGTEERHLQSKLDSDPDLADRLAATGYERVREKKLKRRQVHKYLLNGAEVLEDCGIIAGGNIPIVPAYGKRWFVDNVERCMGHVRLAKDAQRLLNMQLSRLAEIAALSPVRKPIFSPEQISGHQEMWKLNNLKNFAYLLVNAVTDKDGNPMPAGPLAYAEPPDIPQANAALLQITNGDIQELLGSQGEGDKMISNIAEKTVERIQDRLDMQTFIYLSNFAKSIRRVGEIWLGMAREVYVEKDRKMKTVGPMGELGSVALLDPTIEEKTGATIRGADLSRATFDVAVDVGPASASQRRAMVRNLTNMLTVVQDPQTSSVLQSLILMNLEGEGIGEVREYFRKRLVGSGVLKPTEEDEAEMAAAGEQKDPNAEALTAMANEANANATEKHVKVLEILAKIEKIKAETLETLGNLEREANGAVAQPAGAQAGQAQQAAHQLQPGASASASA